MSMARILSTGLINRLLKGDYKKLLSDIRKDRELSLEIRNNKAIVYHHKKKILTLFESKEADLLSDGYLRDDQVKPILDLNNPSKYLNEAKEIVRSHSRQMEFMVQQNIAKSNQTQESKYFVVDMEYAFEHNVIAKEERLKKTRVDLVAIEKETNNIILFELKYGLKACCGNSVVDDHYEKIEKFLAREDFCAQLRSDIANIISDKNRFGLIKFPINKAFEDIKMKYIFAYNSDKDLEKYRNDYANKYEEKGIETLYIDTRYILK